MAQRVKTCEEAVTNLAWIIGRCYPLVDNGQLETAFESVAFLAHRAGVAREHFLQAFSPQPARAQRTWERADAATVKEPS
jgi:hypothetical protein